MKHLGSITGIHGGRITPVDIITAGFPCQDLSVAGNREGLKGERSGLFFEAVRIIREMRNATDGSYPGVVVLENVPGLLSSSKGEDFLTVLKELTEADIPMPGSGRWAKNGVVRTPDREVAWTVLDAAAFGVPQRRRRIFIVCDFRKRSAGEILFEPEGSDWNSQESGKAGEEAIACTGGGIKEASRVFYESGLGQAKQAITNTIVEPNIAQCVTAGTGRLYDQETETLIPVQLYDMTHAEEVMRPAAPGLSPTLNARMGTGGNQVPVMLEVCTVGGKVEHTLRGEGFDVSEDGTGRGAPITAVDCRNMVENEEVSATLQCKSVGGYSLNYQNPVKIGYAVRRLLPVETERLQGFPDGWTDIEGGSDTARYRAIGNSLAIPVVEWIMKRIAVGLELKTMGSLFDGIAGFPESGRRAGIKALWASEIDPFCIRVSQKHFPEEEETDGR